MKGMLTLCLILLLGPAGAQEAVPVAKNPIVESRMMNLASVLRCLVCQNQTIADSHADLAVDLRRQITEMIEAGKSDEEIKQYMVERYGDFVLYQPPFKASTVFLWLGPGLLVVGGVLLFMRGRRLVAEAEPSPADIERARQALSERES